MWKNRTPNRSILALLCTIALAGDPLQAIGQRKLSILTGDIPGRNPGCSIVSIDRLNASRMGQEILALDKGMTPEQVDRIVSGNPSQTYWLISGTEYGVMRWYAEAEGHEIELLLGFRNRMLNAIDLIWKSGDRKCAIGVRD
jgi:hypothetical protein